jgi:hypothetical protein
MPDLKRLWPFRRKRVSKDIEMSKNQLMDLISSSMKDHDKVIVNVWFFKDVIDKDEKLRRIFYE